eukprot:CAMPEP_0168745554 /NCGR_PEP_ID=MMETSP0724-20121128/14678_1 /TAXON_ID=265536 /ORGANISM="Amphiprora sp., Strain CCMP467" /LENGTH=198 /DNA_ID=CAMNT_0008793271 /DNA_START=21 /DNA_END=617 /DNA_ORIENTATION=+
MASGISLRGTPGRCYGFYVDFMECATKQEILMETKVLPLVRQLKSKISALSDKMDANPELKAQMESLSGQIQKPTSEDMMENHPDIRDLVEKMSKKYEATATFAVEDIDKLKELHESKASKVDNTSVYKEAESIVPEMVTINDLARKINHLKKDDKPCHFLREDYFECLHGAKQTMRDMMIFAQEQKLKEGGGDHHGH